MSRFAAFLLLVFGATPVIAQSRSPDPSAPNIKKLLTFDSGTVNFPVLSYDGRWIAFVSGGSLWTASADGRGHAVRITSPGYNDGVPCWLPSNDALTFSSNRPSRNRGSKLYGMTIAIDPNTGRAAGPPRVVTTDEVFFMGHASPDGKWIAYVTAEGDSLKIVPSTGGTSKGVAKLPSGLASPPVWYADGKSIGFTSPLRPNGNNPTWYRVPASGGTPVAVEHAPATGRGLHVHGQLVQPTTHVELRDSTERVVSALDVPRGMSVGVFSLANAALGMMNTHRYVSRIYSVETGTHRMIDGWADGWTSDGKYYMVELTEKDPNGSPGRALAAGIVDNSGKVISQAAFPPDVSNCCAWSGVVGYSFTFGRRSTTALFVADAKLGRTWELAPETLPNNAWAMPLYGRGGEGFSDGGRFLYTTLSEQALEVRAGTAEKKATLLRAFSLKDSTWQPKNLNGSHGVGIHGDRVAWTDRTEDSVTVWVARGPTGTARRVTAFASPKCEGSRRAACHTELVWSQRGDALALMTMDDHPIAAVLRVRGDGALEGAPTILQPNVRRPWNMRWVDGDRAVVVVGRRDREGDDVFVVPVDPASPSRVLTEGNAGEWMSVSPDGKEILFPEVIQTGSSIWRLDFVPSGGANTKSKP